MQTGIILWNPESWLLVRHFIEPPKVSFDSMFPPLDCGCYNVRLTKTNLARILGHGVSISLGPHIVVESNELNEVTSLLKNTHNGV